MTLVAEDGTGLANANSLCGVSTADAFWADRDPASLWAGSTDTAAKEAALVRASDYIRNQVRYRWHGAKLKYTQRMPWPREGAYELDGQAVPNNVVPWAVIEATAFLANTTLSGTDLQPDLAHGGQVTNEKVDTLSVTYAEKARVDTAIQFVDGMLAPLLRRLTADPIIPADYTTTLPEGFRDGDFSPQVDDGTT